MSSSREYIGGALDASVMRRRFMGFGLVGKEADEGNVAAIGVLSSSLGVWDFLGWSRDSEPCQANGFRNSLEKT